MSYLKKEGLASSLGCTPGHDLWSSSNMSIEVTLTDKGLQNYKKVVTSIFEFASYLKYAGP
jgi:secreted Zn-dependent insulinase-like peptidase